jgi:hypothetical protein
MTAAAVPLLRNGNPAPLPGQRLAEGAAAWAGDADRPLVVGAWRGGALQPERVFVYD